MDTLSRKHRLRQQQERRAYLQQQQQQVAAVAYGKENHRIGQFDGDIDDDNGKFDCGHQANNNNIYTNNNNNSTSSYKIDNNRLVSATEAGEEEQDEFRVFKVVEVSLNEQQQQQYVNGRIDSQPVVANGRKSIGYRRNCAESRRCSNNKPSELMGDDDHDFSIVNMTNGQQDQQRRFFASQRQQQVLCSSASLIRREVAPVNAIYSTIDSARSTGDSSGFLSESGSSRSKNGHNNNNYSSSKGIRANANNNHQTEDYGHQKAGRQMRPLPNTQQQNNSNNCNTSSNDRAQNNLRSKVIEDLDQLMEEALGSRFGSPTGSYVSGGACDSSLTRGRELDYSTLCRDEFSGFIAVERKLSSSSSGQNHHHHQPTITHDHLSAANISAAATNGARQPPDAARHHRLACDGGGGGPMLVGVHDTDNDRAGRQNQQQLKGCCSATTNSYYQQQTTSPVDGGSSSDDSEPSYEPPCCSSTPTQDEEIRSSSSGLSTATCSRSSSQDYANHHASSADSADSRSKLHAMCAAATTDYGSSSPTTIATTNKNCQTSQEAADTALPSRLLDIYLSRIDSIRRLAEGDKSVSINDLFGWYDDDDSHQSEIKVSVEHQTQTEFTQLDQPIKVIQEIEMIEMPLNCGGDEQELAQQVGLNKCRIVQATNLVDSNYSSRLADGSAVAPVCPATFEWPLAAAANDQASSRKSLVIDTESQLILEDCLLRRLLHDQQRTEFNDTTVTATSQISHHNAVDNYHQRQHLVNTVKRHLSEFIDDYVTFQSELKTHTSYANDWHQNWLFAYRKRPEDENRLTAGDLGFGLDPKRARMSAASRNATAAVGSRKCSDYAGGYDNFLDTSQQQVDLIRYSTLILNRCNSGQIKIRPLMSPPVSDANDLDKLYEAQQDRLSELYSSAIESSGKIDVCRSLLIDDYDDEFAAGGERKSSRAGKQLMTISYSSTLVASHMNCDQKYRFSAHGYSFETPLSVLITKAARLALIRERITNKMLDLFTSEHEQQQVNLHENGQVRFLVNLTNIELVNNLPVIQFCAKVTGCLPISVQWFSSSSSSSSGGAFDALSDLSSLDVSRKSSLRLRQPQIASGNGKLLWCDDRSCRWPIGMHANYDYEYRNEWGSWYRFRRSQGDLLFEIRDAKWDKDYNRAYRCVVQNYCSKRECSFTLRKRDNLEQPPPSKLAKQRVMKRRFGAKAAAETEPELARKRLVAAKCKDAAADVRADGHALLRTWSQRTLPRQQLHPADANELGGCGGERANGAPPDAAGAHTRQQQTAAAAAAAGDHNRANKFGKDFPYHPENLLKRLEENKFLVSLKCNPKSKLSHQQQQQVAARTTTCDSSPANIGATDSCIQFTDSFEPVETGSNAGAAAADGFSGQQQHHRKLLLLLDENKPQIEQQQQSRQKASPAAPEQHSATTATGNYSQVEWLQMQKPEEQQQAEAASTGRSRLANQGGAHMMPVEPPIPRQRLANRQQQQVTSPGGSDAAGHAGGHPTVGQVSRLNEFNQANIGHRQQQQSNDDECQNNQQQQADAATDASEPADTGIMAPGSIASAAIETKMPDVGGRDSSPSSNKLRGQTIVTEAAAAAAGSNEQLMAAECKPRTNVKSLISRFSLA